jgi:hypothetical protein
VHSKVREVTPRFESDRYWADDIAGLQEAVLGGVIGAGEDLLD